MSIEALAQLIPPPPFPKENGAHQSWVPVESKLGLRLPSDYKQFIAVYGSGSIAGFISLFNPFTNNRYIRLLDQIEDRTEAAKAMKPLFSVQFPFDLYPQTRGLLPFAATGNGDCLYWLTEGDPDSWSVIVVDSREPEWERFNMNTTTFLAEIISKKRLCSIFPRSFPPSNATFT